MMRGALLCVTVVAGSCSLATDFDTSGLLENTALLCADAVDNDGNGLTDCQDFSCLGERACCTIPRVVLREDFAGPACAAATCDAPAQDCDALDPGLWASWGSPEPVVCEESLSPRKQEQCYDVGIYSVPTFLLRPGLSIAVGIIGHPEIKGRLEIGLTLQEEIVGSPDPCQFVTPADPEISVVQLADGDGSRFVARFNRVDVGVSEVTAGSERVEVELRVKDDNRVHYSVNGSEFAVSPADQAVPHGETAVRLTLAGRGLTARFDDVRVTAGSQCDDPRAWVPAEPFIAIDTSANEFDWNGFELFSPAVVPGAGHELSLYYGGCGERFGSCYSLLAGVGSARAADGTAFVADAACPLLGPEGTICPGGLPEGIPFNERFDNILDIDVERFQGRRLSILSQKHRRDQLVAFDLNNFAELGSEATRIRPGPAGSWDASEVCCGTLVAKGDRLELWYAGRAAADQPFQIGRAVSSDGSRFVKDSRNPVLQAGAPGAFDDRGVTEPTVVFDADRQMYRMWYTALGFLGVRSIGYAVSSDGIRWIRSPANPVISAEDLGLASVSDPEAIAIEGTVRLFLRGTTSDRRGARIFALVNRGVDFTP
jgi:hypothetical protein